MSPSSRPNLGALVQKGKRRRTLEEPALAARIGHLRLPFPERGRYLAFGRFDDVGIVEPGHLVLILLIALLVIGPGKLGDLGGSLGRGIREFREATDGRTPTPTPALAAGRYCAKCGASQATESKFCAACGSPVASH